MMSRVVAVAVAVVVGLCHAHHPPLLLLYSSEEIESSRKSHLENRSFLFHLMKIL